VRQDIGRGNYEAEPDPCEPEEFAEGSQHNGITMRQDVGLRHSIDEGFVYDQTDIASGEGPKRTLRIGWPGKNQRAILDPRYGIGRYGDAICERFRVRAIARGYKLMGPWKIERSDQA
jgi:hypothetical protein